MDRDKIERRDFPTGRRGYDPGAVDEHLRRVADEFESRVHPPVPSLSSGTSEQVRQILEATEHSVAEMRAQAGEEASAHVARVQDAADGMLAKLDALEAELSRLLTALRTSGERLTEGLAELQSEVAGGTSRADAADDVPAAGAAPPGDLASPVSAGVPQDAGAPRGADAPPDAGAPPAASAAPAVPVEDFAAAAPAPRGEPDEAGARLIALNMALSGSPREETARYLIDHFALAEPDALLDDVYARAGR